MSTQYKEETSGSLPFYNTGYEQMLGAGAAAAALPYQPYTGQQVANLSGQQNQAFELASSNVNNWRPNIDQAQGYIQGSAAAGQPGYDQAQAGFQGAMGADLQNLGWSNYANAQGLYMGSSQFDPSQVQQYLNPYLGGVVNEIGRLGQEQFSEQTVPTLSNAYSSLGQFGSARQGMMLSDAAARNQRETLGQQGQFLQQGYDSAMSNYGDWANRAQSAAAGMTNIGQQQYAQGLGQSQNQIAGATGLQNLGAQRADDAYRAGTAMGNLGQARQQLGISDYGQLLSSGTLQQSQNQKVLDTQRQNWDQQQQYPWQQVQNWAQLFPAAPQASSSWASAFKKGGLARFKEGGVVRGMAGGGQFEDTSDIQTILAQLSNRPTAPRPQPPQQASSNVADYARSMGLMDQLKPVPQPSFGHRAGRAMMESAAQKPTNWGQAIGQSGQAYYGNEDTRLAGNAARAKLAGELMGLDGRGRGAANFEGKVVPGVGLVNYDPNTGEANVAMSENRVATMLPQLYAHAVREASAAEWPNEQTKREWIDNRVQQMLSDAASRGAGVLTPGENSLPGGMPPGATPLGARRPEQSAGFRAAGGDVAQAMKDIESIADPVERQMAMEALQRSYPQRSAQPQEAWPSAFSTGQILSPQEQAESEKVGAGLGVSYTNLQQGAADARSKVTQVNRIANLLSDVNTGKLTPLVTEIQGWAEALGVPAQYIEGLSEKQAAQSLMGQFALQLRNPEGGAGMPGALSDRDLIFLQSMVPSLANTPEGNRLILDTFRKQSERSIKVAELARRYRRENPRGTFDDGFYDYLAEWAAQNPVFDDADFERAGLPIPGGTGGRIRINPEDLE